MHKKIEGKTGFVWIVHAYGHIWKSDWSIKTRLEAMSLIWRAVCKGEV
jgi:hypothetical protein